MDIQKNIDRIAAVERLKEFLEGPGKEYWVSQMAEVVIDIANGVDVVVAIDDSITAFNAGLPAPEVKSDDFFCHSDDELHRKCKVQCPFCESV